MNGKKSHQFRVFTNSLAFLILIAVTGLLIAGKFVPNTNNLPAILNEIAKYLSIFLVALASLWYAISKRGIVPKIIWVICVVAIVGINVL